MARRLVTVISVLLTAAACHTDPAAPVTIAVRQYCATTQGLVHEFAWPWNDSTAEWTEIALADSAPIGGGYCLTLDYHTATSGEFSGGGSFGAWFDTWEMGLVDTMPLWYLRNDTAQGSFAITSGGLWLSFTRGGKWLKSRTFLLHSVPTEEGFTTTGRTVQQGQGYLNLVLRWHPVEPVSSGVRAVPEGPAALPPTLFTAGHRRP